HTAPARACRRLDRINDGLVAGTAAIISGKMLADLLAAWSIMPLEQVLRSDQHARGAIAALQCVAITERPLQVRDLAAIRQTFNSPHIGPTRLHGEHQAGSNDLAIEAHRACTTHAMFTADVSTCQMQMLPKKIRQVKPRQDLCFDVFTVD